MAGYRLLPNVLLSATHCTEEGRKSTPSGADLVIDVGKALSLDFGREVLFVRNLQQSGLEVIREDCLKDAGLEAEGSRMCAGRERREEQALSDGERVRGGPGLETRQGARRAAAGWREGRCLRARARSG